MKKYNNSPNIWTTRSLVDHINNGVQCMFPDGRIAPSRPLGLDNFPARFKAAWLVFTGKADAVTWDER